MQHPEGGFFSSQDADSEGVEGKFFVWSWDELVELVGPAVAACFGATPEGNWEGTNVLWRPRAVADVAAEHGLSVDELGAEVEDARQMLFEIRERRVTPGTDDKVLTAWNALAIGAFAEAGRVFGEPSYVRGGGPVRRVRARRISATIADGSCAPGGTALRAGRGSPTTTR